MSETILQMDIRNTAERNARKVRKLIPVDYRNARSKIQDKIWLLLKRAAPLLKVEHGLLKDATAIGVSYLQSVHVTKSAIEGCFFQKAMAAIKQDIEMAAKMEECLKGVDREGRTPNVGNLVKGFGKVYGKSNELAHPSHMQLLAETLLIRKHESGAVDLSVLPIFDGNFALSIWKFSTAVDVQVLFSASRMVKVAEPSFEWNETDREELQSDLEIIRKFSADTLSSSSVQ